MPRITTEELVGQQAVDISDLALDATAGAFAVYDCTVVMLQMTGAFTEGAVAVEYSTDECVSFFPAQQIRAAGEAYLGEQIGFANKGVTFLVDVRACTHIRLKCTTTIVGGCNMLMQSARWTVDPLLFAITQGAAAEGAVRTKAGNMVLVGGHDGANLRALRTDTNGNLTVKLTTGSASIGNVGISPATSHNLAAAATTNATSVKTSAASLYSIMASNTGAVIRYLKLYNKASAPTVGTDVPILTLPIPAGSFINPPLGAMGIRFATGLAYAITTGAADTDTAAVSATGEVKVKLDYV